MGLGRGYSSVPRLSLLQSAHDPHVNLASSPSLQGKRVLLAEDNLINQTVAKKMLTQLGMVAVVAANGAEAVDAVTSPGSHFDVVLMDMAMPVMGGVSATKVRAWTRCAWNSGRCCWLTVCFDCLFLRKSVASASGRRRDMRCSQSMPRACNATTFHPQQPSARCMWCRSVRYSSRSHLTPLLIVTAQNIRGRGLEVPIVAMTANASDKDRDECLDAGMDGFLSKPVLKDRLAEVRV